jgi:hypothetical protein
VIGQLVPEPGGAGEQGPGSSGLLPTGLRLDEHRQQQRVVAGEHAGGLTGIVPQGQAQAAQVGPPAFLELGAEVVPARPNETFHHEPPVQPERPSAAYGKGNLWMSRCTTRPGLGTTRPILWKIKLLRGNSPKTLVRQANWV